MTEAVVMFVLVGVTAATTFAALWRWYLPLVQDRRRTREEETRQLLHLLRDIHRTLRDIAAMTYTQRRDRA